MTFSWDLQRVIITVLAPHVEREKKQAFLKDTYISKIKQDVQLYRSMRGRRNAQGGGVFIEILDPAAKNSSSPQSKEEACQRKNREHNSFCVGLLLFSLFSQEK